MSLSVTAFRAIAALCFCLLLPGAVHAESECDEWFPDFNCEGREARYEGFSTTNSMPYLFEDPFITTGVFGHLIWHEFPGDSALGAGKLWVVAVQARLAITDRLAFIATKDGYTWLRPSSTSAVSSDQGFFDIAAGFKYALIDRPEDGLIVTPSFRIDIPVGNAGVLSGNGDGVAIPAVSSAYAMGPVNAIAGFGARIPFNTSKEASSVYYNLNLHTNLIEGIVPFIELNGTTWTRSASGRNKIPTKPFGSIPIKAAQDFLKANTDLGERRFEGLDVVNLGSSGVAGKTVMSLAFGARVPVGDRTSIGAYYEFPVTNRKMIFQQRAAVNVLFEL